MYIIEFNTSLCSQTALIWLRESKEVENEMNDMRLEKETLENRPKVTYKQMFSDPTLRQPLIIAFMMMMSQQFSGINAAIFFSSQIFISTGLSKKVALYATIGMGVANLIFTIVSLVLVEKTGRRTLHLVGLSGMAATSVAIVLCLSLLDQVSWLSYVSIFCVYMFVIWFSIGPGSIPWFFVGEMFDSGSIGLASSLATCVNWLANFLVALLFLPLQVRFYHFLKTELKRCLIIV